MISAMMAKGNISPTDLAQIIPVMASQFAQQSGAGDIARTIGNFATTAESIVKGDWGQISKSLGNTVKNAAESFIPLSSEGKQIIRASQSTTGKTDTLGNPISSGSPSSRLLSLALPGYNAADQTDSTGNIDPVKGKIDRLAKAGFETMPAQDIKNKQSQTDAKLLMGTDIYTNADDQTKADMLHKALLGTATSNINAKLTPEQRTSLIEATILTGDQRTAWLENVQNAKGYYVATLANKQANGTLTAADRDLQSTGSDAYKAVLYGLADNMGLTPDDLQVYKDTSKSEFNNMSAGELKNKLAALDAALAGAGATNKYGGSAGGARGSANSKLSSVMRDIATSNNSLASLMKASAKGFSGAPKTRYGNKKLSKYVVKAAMGKKA
jgi:hypothetical protein